MSVRDSILKALGFSKKDIAETAHRHIQDTGTFKIGGSGAGTISEDKDDYPNYRDSKDSIIEKLNLRTCSGLLTAYDECSVVSMILSRLANALANGRVAIRNKETKVETTYNYKSILKLLANPNAEQTYVDFIVDLDITKYLYGAAVVYAPKILGLKEVEGLYVIDPEHITVKYKAPTSLETAIVKVIESIHVEIDSKIYDAKPEEIFIIYDTPKAVVGRNKSNTTLDGYQALSFKSRLNPLTYEVRNIIQAQEAIYSLNKDRGPQGFLTNDKRDTAGYIPLTSEEKAELRKLHRTNYGLSNNKDKIVISDAAVKWQPTSYNIKELMLFEGIKSNMCSIADAYNYPFELIANDKGTTFSNKSSAKAYLYQDNVIPNAKKVAEFLSDILKLREGDEFYFDFSHLEVFQQSAKDAAVSQRAVSQSMYVLYQSGAITKEEFRRECGLDDEVFGTSYIETQAEVVGFSITNQSPDGTGYDNNDIEHNE